MTSLAIVEWKKTMTYRRFQKLTQYLHVSNRSKELAQNSVDYDKLYKIHPVLNMVQDNFAESYKPGENQIIDKGMITSKGRPSHVQYLPNKPIKKGSKEWMNCDADTAYLHQFKVYLALQQNEFGLGYDMVMKWSYVRIYQEKIMSIVITCFHLSSHWRTCWLEKHNAVGQYKSIRNILQIVFVNLVEWFVVLTNDTRMAVQTWWPLFGKTI